MTKRAVVVRVDLDALERVIDKGGMCLCNFEKKCPCEGLTKLTDFGESCTCGVFTKVG